MKSLGKVVLWQTTRTLEAPDPALGRSPQFRDYDSRDYPKKRRTPGAGARLLAMACVVGRYAEAAAIA